MRTYVALATLLLAGLLPAAAHADRYGGYRNYGHGGGHSHGGGSYHGGGGHHGGYHGGGKGTGGYARPAGRSGGREAHISPGQGMRGRAYRQGFGSPRYNSWGRQANFTESKPHRGTWNKRYNTWVKDEQERQEASNITPCGMYGRSPAACKATMPYIPWIHGDR